MILVAPTEPDQLKAMGVSSSVPEQYGADVLVPAVGEFMGVQRKTFPADFLSSLSDGRLATSLVKLSKCRVRVLVLEGQPVWTSSGALYGHEYGQGVDFKRSQLRSLLLSASTELGVTPVWTDDLTDTVEFIETLARWGMADQHLSLFGRPRQRVEWERDGERLQAAHILQGFDGIGAKLALDIFDHFKRIPLAWSVSAGELRDVKGLGPGRVDKMTRLIPTTEEHADE